MKIYDIENFPNPLRVRIALKEKGVTEGVEFVHVDLPEGEHREPHILKLNPIGTVPILELDDGTIISESSAITEFIDSNFGEPTLLGRNAKDRGVIHMMQRRAELMVLEPLGDYFHQATAGLGPKLEKNQNKAWGERRKDWAMKGFAYFDEHLKASKYTAGEEFSVADIALYACVVTAQFVGLDVLPEYGNLNRWHSLVKTRPSFN